MPRMEPTSRPSEFSESNDVKLDFSLDAASPTSAAVILTPTASPLAPLEIQQSEIHPSRLSRSNMMEEEEEEEEEKRIRCCSGVLVYAIVFNIVGAILFSMSDHDGEDDLGPALLWILSFLQPAIIMISPHSLVAIGRDGLPSLVRNLCIPIFFVFGLVGSYWITFAFNPKLIQPFFICTALVHVVSSVNLWFCK
jgi:hypothetical protein